MCMFLRISPAQDEEQISMLREKDVIVNQDWMRFACRGPLRIYLTVVQNTTLPLR